VNTDPEPDILEIIIAACRDSGLDIESANVIEQGIRDKFGGMRVRIPKRKKSATALERKMIFADGVTGMSTEEVTAKHKISRATLYRVLKRGTA